MPVEYRMQTSQGKQELTQFCSGDTNDNHLVIVMSLPCYFTAFLKNYNKLNNGLVWFCTHEGNEQGEE